MKFQHLILMEKDGGNHLVLPIRINLYQTKLMYIDSHYEVDHHQTRYHRDQKCHMTNLNLFDHV